jgi:lysyl-tRNA synthetase class 1
MGGVEERDKDLLRAYELAQPNGVRAQMPLQVPYRHLVQIVQITSSFDVMLEILKRSERITDIKEGDAELLRQRAACVRFWLDNFAPEDVKFHIAPALPSCELSEVEVRFLREVHAKLSQVEWSGDRSGRSMNAPSLRDGARRVSGDVLDIHQQKQGHAPGCFLSTLDKPFVLGRISPRPRRAHP